MHTHVGLEYGTWVLCFSILVLHEISPTQYLSHFSNFVAGVQILSSNQVTQQDIQTVESYLVSLFTVMQEYCMVGCTCVYSW